MSNTKRYDLQSSPGYRLTLLASINNRKFERALSDLDLTRLMWCVLLAVDEEHLEHPSDIAAFIGIDRTAASRTIRQMKAAGLIDIDKSQSDGRSRRVKTTASGKAVLDRSLPLAMHSNKSLKSKLDADELEIFERLIDKMLAGEPRNVSNL